MRGSRNLTLGSVVAGKSSVTTCSGPMWIGCSVIAMRTGWGIPGKVNPGDEAPTLMMKVEVVAPIPTTAADRPLAHVAGPSDGESRPDGVLHRAVAARLALKAAAMGIRTALWAGRRAGLRAGLRAGRRAGRRAGLRAGPRAGRRAGLRAGVWAARRAGRRAGRRVIIR